MKKPQPWHVLDFTDASIKTTQFAFVLQTNVYITPGFHCNFCSCEESLYFGDSILQQMLLFCMALYYGNLMIHQYVANLEKAIST